MQTIFVTGAGGYIGIPLVGRLLDKGYKVIGLDRYYFGQDLLPAAITNNPNFKLLKKDTRGLTADDFKGVDTVMDLAGLSNDPSCELSTELTFAINRDGALHMARCAKEAGVHRFIYSSSCSVYGAGKDSILNEESSLHPVSCYAESKIAVERGLHELMNSNFEITILRNATVYGLAPRMRFDLVVNMMTLYAWREKKIYIMGGGEQWRPLVHVNDVGKAFTLVGESPSSKVKGKTFNVGSSAQNYRIADIAATIKKVIPREIELISIPEDADKRSYHIQFDRIAEELGYKPDFTITDGAREVYEALESNQVDHADPRTVTVKYYNYLIKAAETIRQVSIEGRVL